MSSFVVKGYQAPKGVRYKEQVEEVQRLIGAKVDGKWGGESQRKWEAFQKREPSRMAGYMLAYSMALDTGEKRHRESVRQARAEESLRAQEYNRRQNAQARTVAGYTKPKEYQLVSQVEAFQRAQGLKVDGVWGPASQAAYQKSKEQETAPARALKGYRIPTEYNTVAKLKAFQEKNGLKVDGVWGPQTDAEYKRLKAPKITNLVELKKQDAEAMQKLKAEQSTPARALRGYRVPAEYNTVFKLKVFQNKYGLKQDGVWGPDCEKAYQMEKQAARRAQEQRKREQEQERARQQEQERLAEMRQNGQTPQDLDPTAAGMRGYNQMNIPRGTQSRSNPPTTKAAAPQDSDPATQALRGPNRLKATGNKTNAKTTGGGKKSPQDVNTDAMRGFHNPDYAEQDENWVRNDDFLTDVNPSLQKVVDSGFTEWDVINQIITNERLAELWGHIPIIGYKDDARAAEMEASIDEVTPHIPGNLPFTEKDIASARVGVIVDVKQLAAHGGGTKEQRKEATRQIWQRTIIQWLLGLGLDYKLKISEKLDEDELGKMLNKMSDVQDISTVVDLLSKSLEIQDEESRKRLEQMAEKALKTQRYLASLQMYDMYYRVSLKQWRQNPSLGAIAGGAYQIENFGNEPTVLIYFRPTTGANGSKGFRTLFVLREDTMEVIWP